MTDGNAHLRYIHPDPPFGLLETQILENDIIMRFAPDLVQVADNTMIKMRQFDKPELPQAQIEDNKIERSLELPNTLIQPPWEEKYERTNQRVFETAINYQPNATPLYYTRPLF